MDRYRISIVLIIGALLVSACASATSTLEVPNTGMDEVIEGMGEDPINSTGMEVEDKTDEDQVIDPTPELIMADEEEEGMVQEDVTNDSSSNEFVDPEWFSVDLMDVNSGQKFKVEDFRGKVVLVETMAMWCSTCFRQQKEVLELHDILGNSDSFISLTLDIDPNEIAEDLQVYTKNNGFYWLYAVSPPNVSREIAELYGDKFLNPPSAPMFVIDSEGQVHPLRYGVKDAQELLETLQLFLDAAM